MQDKDLFIGEFEQNLIEGHRFALRLDFRRHKNLSEEDTIHQHMYALFLLLGSIEWYRQQLDRKIDQVLQQKRCNFANFSSACQLDDCLLKYLRQFKQLLKNIGKEKLINLFRSKQIFQIISHSLKYLVFRHQYKNISIRELLNRMQRLYQFNYDVLKTYSYRYIKINVKQNLSRDMSYDLLIQEALDENRVGTGIVYYVCKTQQAYYNGQKVEIKNTSFDDLINSKSSIIDPNGRNYQERSNSWDDTCYEESEFMSENDALPNDQTRSQHGDKNKNKQVFRSAESQYQYSNEQASQEGQKQCSGDEESVEEDEESEVNQYCKVFQRVVVGSRQKVVGQGFWETIKKNQNDMAKKESYVSFLSKEKQIFDKQEKTFLQRQIPKVEVIRKDNKNLSVLVLMNYKYPKPKQENEDQSDLYKDEKCKDRVKLKTLKSLSDETANQVEVKKKELHKIIEVEDQGRKYRKKTMIKFDNGNFVV